MAGDFHEYVQDGEGAWRGVGKLDLNYLLGFDFFRDQANHPVIGRNEVVVIYQNGQMGFLGGAFGVYPNNVDGARREGLIGIFEDVGAFLDVEGVHLVGNIHNHGLIEFLVDGSFYDAYKMVF